MALMQVFPRFTVGQDAYVGEKPIPIVRSGKKVEFRSGADLSGVVEEIRANLRVEVEAAPGAGKSSRLPLALAKATGALVVHVVPHLHIGVSVHRFMSKLSRDVKVVLAAELSDEWPETGVVVVPATLVVAKWLSEKRTVLPPCYVLQDESHESGAASAVLRALTPVCEGVLSHVMMSATPGTGEARRMETGGNVAEVFYEPSAFADPWSVEDDNAPWAVSALNDHVLIFEDDRRRALSLVEAYNMNGARAYLLHSGTTVREFSGVLDALEDRRSATPCVVIVDSSYRSGHTFLVSLTIDSGLVKRVVVNKDGRPVNYVRPMYAGEALQAMCRTGRVPGQRSVYYRPRGELERKVCDLEQTDVEAATLIFRALGFGVPKWARGAKMAEGSVPEDLWKALVSRQPLALLTEDQLVHPDRFSKSVAPDPLFYGRADSAFGSTASQYGEREVEPRGPEVDLGVRKVSFSPEAVPPPAPEVPEPYSFSRNLETAADVVRVALAEPEPTDVEFGEFYCARGVSTSSTTCFAFPDGADSVKRLLAHDQSHTLHFSWSNVVRSVAVNLLLNAYNKDMLEVHAYTDVLRVVKSGGVAMTTPVRKWVSGIAERLSAVANRSEYVLGLADRVAYDFCSLVRCDGIFDEEKSSLVSVLVEQYERACPAVVDTRHDELSRVKAWREQLSVGSEGSSDFGGTAGREARIEVGPASRNYTGHPSSRFLRWTAGMPIASSSSVSVSKGQLRRSRTGFR